MEIVLLGLGERTILDSRSVVEDRTWEAHAACGADLLLIY